MISRAKFDRIREQVLDAMAVRDELRARLERKYQDPRWASAAELALLERRRAAYDRQAARMFKLLEQSPRAWSRGVPAYWVAECLTYEDAIRPTSEPLSAEPPRAWGY